MVRETRHLWVGNLPDNIREDRIREHFKRYGRVQSVKLLPRVTEEKTGEITMACTVAFMDIKSASKAHNAELKIDDRTLNTEYYEPAAIPSAASPQNVSSPYSTTSPGATRFPNGHGSTDEPFPDRFYDRTPSGRVAAVTAAAAAADVEFGRRGPSAPANSYHEGTRGRPRDRSFRNGPYNSGGGLPERHNRTAAPNNTWSYENTRYNNSSTGSQSETGYSTTPSDGAERRGSDAGGVRKKTKSRSGTRSPSPGGSTSSRSPSRSRSRSSSSSSSSSTSRATSSTGSPKSRRQAAATATQTTGAEDRRPLAICVKNLPLRSSDTSLKDGLFHEYKKHGKVTWVKVVGQSTDRHAIVCFKKPEDVEKALEVSQDKLFFGCRIEVAPHTVCDVEDNDLRPYEAEIDEYHPKATRTLFIGNLEKDVTASDLRKHFDQFGEIIEIDIKKQGAVSSYAFCQYSDIVSVVKAIRKMDGEHLGNNRIKLGFGKSMPYNCVWIDGINENVNEKYLRMQFETFGVISRCIIDREKGQSLLFYEQVLHAQQAVNKMRGFVLKNTKLQVDFASRECQECFFERLEKQGTILDRTLFEDRREPATRGFESAAAARFSRYDTPTRPRTSSYSSRSSAAASQVPSAIPSPGTPGSVTPRGTSSRRIARYYDYEQADYDRHFRSYDEYSQGSAASHEDAYEHDYIYSHDSPSHLDSLEVRVMQNVVDAVPFAPPDIRNLQKERLEECASSGDELISPKKRLKLDMLDPVADVIIEANRDHRKVMEVRRLSDANMRHHRRPSMDSGKYKEAGVHDRGYMPHTVGCKRRKTNSSDGGTRVHHYDHSGSESVGGSRPGTPLCDEKPEFPSEPRRVPREREGPLTLPLPRFAAQIMNRGSVSVAGIKGQKDAVNILSSPPPATTSPRIANPRPPSPVHVPPPASPPPRPPSLSSNSSDSDGTPPSPSLEERIRSLDEKYEKWSGSRALSAAGGDALALLDANLEKFRQRHKLLDLDLKEVQPSEIVKSVMAKRSVFDEDLKRLENVGEKYEPKEFSLFPRASVLTPPLPVTPVTAPLPLKLPPVTQLGGGGSMPSPRSSGGTPSTLPAAKGLQYPFPSHPPVQLSTQQTTPTTSPVTTTAPSSTPLPAPTSTTTTTAICRGNSHGENRLKLCASASSDTRTFSKINANRNTVPAALSSVKDKSETVDAPIAPTKVKSSDKTSEKVSCRRDSNSNSPRADVKTRRNSDTSARRIEENSKFGEMSESSSKNQERAKSEERKKEQRLEKVRLENERSEKERLERERIEKERIEKEKQERERLEREKLEKERLERESELEKQRLEKERLEKERQELEKTKQEKERAEKEKARLEKERERAEKARQEKERVERERLESERIEKERQEEQRRKDKEREQKERDAKEQERSERERKERERVALQEKELLEKQEKERKECERKEREDRERKEREEKSRQEEEERTRKERAEKEKQEKERSRHKEDNHHHEKKEHSSRHRENHSETKYRENNIDKHLHDGKSTKESSREEKSNKDVVHDQVHRRDLHESRSNHENSRSGHEKSRHHSDRDAERRKESIKENRDNNIHDRHKNLVETKDHRDRAAVETRHLSIDMDKSRSSDSHSKQDPNRRKERNNSLPANVGVKRRISSQDILENSEECKKIKLDKKLSERRDSKDSSRSEEKSRSSKHKNISMRSSHDKHGTGDEKRKDKDDRHKKHKLEKKSKSKSREKESRELSVISNTISDKDFMARLNLKSVEEVEKQRKEFREGKEKRKESVPELEKREEKKISEERPKKDRTPSVDSKESGKPRDEISLNMSEERKSQKRERIRKMNSSDSDSDEPKKHSIFDIVDDEPAYISMYDKVKARSCKNMQKQEEEKRQEKIKAKFSQLKQSRARREEKKRSTSWDEDSDSDKETTEVKFRRHPKMLIDSSDESQDQKVIKKEGNYSDSDSFVMHQVKSEPLETTDDEVKNKHVIYKSLKSRITSDTSDDDYQKSKLSRLFSESEPTFAEVEEKLQKTTSVKTEIQRLIKKERRNSKYQESDHAGQIFNDVSEPKPEKYNTVYTSDDDTVDVKKEKLERKEKKHKKKQKKQKHSHSSEESVKMDTDYVQSEDTEKPKHHEKRKDHCKKEKKRDKTRDGKDRSKKSKKNKSDAKMDVKCEGKMENIFGSLSEDSDNGVKDVAEKIQTSASFLTDENAQQPPFNSDSDREAESKQREEKNKERERDREEHKRRKEKKRRDKERRLQEAAAVAAAVVVQHNSNENSMDYVDMGKQLEANIKDDVSEETEIKTEIDSSNHDTTEDTFTLSEHTEDTRKDKDERKEVKEVKEKKKKRKKSKDEKTKHHHHHHHDKTKVRSPEIKKEVPTDKIKTEPEEPKDAQNVSSQSLPSILESSPEHIKPSPDFTVSPSTREMLPLISPIPKTPTSSKEKKREKLIPCFGVEIDEKIHESAIKSISEFEPATKTDEVTTEAKEEPPTEPTEDKPRVIISQEETEDAVAALLGESFGREEFEECYPEDIVTVTESVPIIAEENNAEDDEEMRQAVQSLSAADLDVKPETPQSEHELQIDTDTEDQDDNNSSFEPATKTPASVTHDLSKPPKTPDIQCLRPEDKVKTLQPVIYKATSIGSPPSLTPIKPVTTAVETKKTLEEPKSLPLLPEQQQRSVITQSWAKENTRETIVSKPDSVTVPEEAPPQSVISQVSSTRASSPVKTFRATPVITVKENNYPPLASLSKDSLKLSPVAEQKLQPSPIIHAAVKSQTVSQLHNLPARPPVQISKPAAPAQEPNLLSPKSSAGLTLNRLPITPVMASKPIQPTTVFLPQSKIAHSLEPPKLVSTSDPRSPERPRMVFQTASIQQPYSNFGQNQPRVLMQGNIRHIPPPGLLMPTRHLPPTTYGYMPPHSTCESMPDVKRTEPSPVKLSTSVSSPNSQLRPTLAMSSATVLPQVSSPLLSLPSYNPNSMQQPSLILPVSVACSSPKSFIQTQSPNMVTTHPIMQTNSTVIQEPPKLVGTPLTSEVQYKPVELIATESKVNDTTVLLSPKNLEGKVISAPSPVIVPNPLPETHKVDDSKLLSPVKLAIEKVTEELNMSLTKEVEDKEYDEQSEEEPELKTKVEEPQEHTKEKPEDTEETETKDASFSNEPAKLEEEKMLNTEIKIKDEATEGSDSTYTLAKDDPLDTKEDSDYWSAKEVNIDSVIKTLASADELSEHGSEDNVKDGWLNEQKEQTDTDTHKQSDQSSLDATDLKQEEPVDGNQDENDLDIQKNEENVSTRGGRNRGRGGRGRKVRGAVERGGITTRRGKLAKEVSTTTSTPAKRGRGGRPRHERKSSRSESDSAPSDVYEFRDDSDDNNKEQRPRLVLTIKSSSTSSTNNSHTTAIVKEITKDGAKEIGKEVVKETLATPATHKQSENKDEFVSPQTNTRKSRRLQEKDIKNTVDDTIEDVVKNTIQTRSSSNQRKSTRLPIAKQIISAIQLDTPRKSPRGRKPRRGSEAAENSSSEETPKEEVNKPVETLIPPQPPMKEPEKEQKPVETPREKAFGGVKAAMLRRLKGEMAARAAASHEPTNLIDPVTGLLIPMRECEEGRYIPLPDQKSSMVKPTSAIASVEAAPVEGKPQKEPVKSQLSNVPPPSQQVTVVQQQSPKLQSLKAHVLNSQAAKAVVTQQPQVIQAKPVAPVMQVQQSMPQQHSVVVTKTVTPIAVSKPVTPLNQTLNINTSVAMGSPSVAHLSPRPNIPNSVTAKPQANQQQQQMILSAQQKQFIQTSKPLQHIPKAHMHAAPAQIVNTQMAHMKQNVLKQPQVIMGKGPVPKTPHTLHQQQILTGAVASPPLTKTQAPSGRIIQGPPPGQTKGVMEPPKVDVSMSNIMLGRPNLSPGGHQSRITGLPVSGFEASLGEAITHFPPGALRPPPELNPAHYMHTTHVLQYQQFLRQQQLQHLQRSAGLEKSGEEGEEAPVTSPPLELRRPGSVGLALSGRGAAVPHSLHSPHDRATESPQMGQVYSNMPHSSRIPPYHPNRYYDQAEPPPAHRPLTSHGSLAALGSDRGLAAHLQPDRPLSGSHLPPDRPLSSHTVSAHMGGMPSDRMSSHIERPLSSHGIMGAGLGAAGNLMGAVAKHIGVEAPTSQRGLQAATPPHASQVPPQAESLLMLLKQYPLMWQGLLALKNDQAAVQMYFVSGNDNVAKCSLPKNTDGTTPPLRIFQRMRLEPPQVEGVARKMQTENEHCMLLALPCGHDHMDVLKQSTNLTNGFITYLQQKQAAGIVNVAAPGTTQPPAYVVHIFPSCDFVNENLRRIAPSLLERVADIAHLLIVITTV